MDVHYKTYAGRSSRDIRFDQLLHTKPLSGSSSTAFSKSSVSSRKRVNVVSFVPTGEGQELVTKSPDKIVSENSDSSACAGAVQTNISQSYLTHSSTEGVTTGSPNLSYSSAHTECPSRPPNINMTNNNPFGHPSDCTLDVRSVRSTNFKSDHCRSNIALTPLSSHTPTIQRVSSPNSHRSVTNYHSHPVCTSKPASQPKLQGPDKNETSLVVTIPNSSLKTQAFVDISKNSRERSSPYSCPALTLEPEIASDASASKSFSRPILSGKNKRAAYNPRSWQKEIETEDSSPTKLQKVNDSSPCSQNPSQSSTESHHFTVKDAPPVVNQENCNMKIHKNNVDNFAFDEYEEEMKNNFDALHPYKYSINDKHSVKYCDKLVEEDEDLEDDVKPWFRPASRDVSNKNPSNSSKNMKVSRTDKPLYTVLHKVKEAHVCQEQGETQHLLDDVEYLVDGLTDRNQVNTRALSVLTLANKCLTASFRYTLNAHGLLKRICAKLHDAYTDYALALTSAGLLFVLSRDRDPNILDVDSLAIILKLFSAPDTNANGSTGGGHCEISKNKEAERVRMRVRQLLDGLHQNNSKSLTPAGPDVVVGNNPNTIISSNQSLFSSGKRSILPPGSKTPTNSSLNTRHLQITRQLTTSDLVIESILNFGTRKAGDWFKVELRNGGGLDRVADAASDAVDYLADLDPNNTSRKPTTVWRSRTNLTGIDNFALDRLKRVCHYTRLLENMTYMNSDNQTYLVHYRDGILVKRLLTCLRVCVSHLPKSSNQQSNSTTTTNNNVTMEKPTVNSVNVLSNSNNSAYDSQTILTDCILGIFRFLVNVSHNEFASERLGACAGFLETIFDCLLKLPDRLPGTKRFDVIVLVLCLLVNMCEHCPENRTRIVYLDITKSCLKQGSPTNVKDIKYIDTYDDEEEDDDDDVNTDTNTSRQVVTTSALDELIQLFLTREECARNHDFERDDDEAMAAAAARKRSEELEDFENNPKQLRPGYANPTVEEAGLKWRLIEDRRAMNLNNRGLLGRNKKRLYRKQKCKSIVNKQRQNIGGSDEDEEDSDDVDDLNDDDDDDCIEDDDLEENDDDDEDDDDDESVGSGADVEFVADTQEEQEKLAKSMSQAQQHMEDSVVAAYAALLLGCILQSSPRYTDRIRSKLPDGQFRPLAIMLAKLLSFLSLTKGVGSSGSESILRIVRILEAQDKQNTKISTDDNDGGDS
ncbi:unnamed protein product [Schistosoma rodhaini]|uniref:WAPL domain-containing protein n=1 Tax=Schistosoma rodhaini TaxID=6188 RepID=A0AA85G797_9TREM|nr:unnamed protein product [Schistosoma rodhaini]